MSWQLIYTSVPRGLSSGQSGFCTVARSADLREALVQRLEQISSYHYLRLAEAATAHRNPTISAFRLLDLRGAKYCVLTRIQPCGLDFTARTNHLAHHLVFQPEELAQLPSPAAILLHWPGWAASWQGDPRLLPSLSPEAFAAAAKSCLPAQTWMRMAGDAGRAAGLLESDCLRGCYLVCPPGSEGQVLEMYCETLQLLNLNGQYALRPWRHPFTTFLQAEDNPLDFQWRACQEGTPAYEQAVQRRAALLPLASVSVPNNSLVKPAREGLKPPAPSPSAPDLKCLPAGRSPPTAPPNTTASNQSGASRRSSGFSLIGAYAEVKLRLSMMQQWFSNRSAASRASIGIFAAVLLGLMAMRYWGQKHHPAPPVAPPIRSARAPAVPAPPAGQTPSPPPISAQAEPPDPKQLDWLSAHGRTFVLVTSDLTRFNLPMDQIGPFESLIHGFDKLQLFPKDIQLSVNTNTWDPPLGAPMSLKANTHELSAQTASGLGCSFNYEDFLRDAKPVAVTTVFATPPGAWSVQFRFSSPNHGEPFRLLIVNESHPPAPKPLSLRWLKINRAPFADPLLQGPWREILGRFTLLQGLQWQLRPFVKFGPRTNYLYENWPAADLPPAGQELDFAGVTNRLKESLSDVVARLKLNHKIGELTLSAGILAAYPLGKDLGLPDPLTSFSTWTNASLKTNAQPLPALFLSYLGELQKEGAANTDNDWFMRWPPFSDDDTNLLNRNLQMLYFSWIRNVPGASNNPAFPANYFSTNWQTLAELESVQQQEQLLQRNSVRERLKRFPGSLDDTAYVGLFIIDPTQPRRGLEIIRFEGE